MAGFAKEIPGSGIENGGGQAEIWPENAGQEAENGDAPGQETPENSGKTGAAPGTDGFLTQNGEETGEGYILEQPDPEAEELAEFELGPDGDLTVEAGEALTDEAEAEEGKLIDMLR